MSWSYSGDPADSQLDELRFIIQDTDTGLQLLSDEELGYLIGVWMPKYDSIIYVGAIAAATIARKFATLIDVSADGVAVSTGSLVDRYTKLATMLVDEFKRAGVGAQINIDNVLVGHGTDYSIRPLRFAMDMMDNPSAGVQDFGGWTYDPFVDVDTNWTASP